MTHEQLQARVFQLLDNAHEHAKRKAERLIRSGAVDVENATDFAEAKCIAVASLRDAASGYVPSTGKYRDVLDNLECF